METYLVLINKHTRDYVKIIGNSQKAAIVKLVIPELLSTDTTLLGLKNQFSDTDLSHLVLIPFKGERLGHTKQLSTLGDKTLVYKVFPKSLKCPFCDTSEEGETVFIKDKEGERLAVHLKCLVDNLDYLSPNTFSSSGS
jgi:hypothetical protein